MILRLLARGRTGRRTAIPARTVETPRRSSVNLFKGHTTRCSRTAAASSRPPQCRQPIRIAVLAPGPHQQQSCPAPVTGHGPCHSTPTRRQPGRPDNARSTSAQVVTAAPPPADRSGSRFPHPRRPRQGRRRLRGAQGEHPGRGQEQHPDEGHDHALRAVRRGRARPDLRAHPRGLARAKSSGRRLGGPKGLSGRLHGSTARRPVSSRARSVVT